MEQIERITMNPEVMGGKPCIRGLRVTVGTVVGLLATGHTAAQVLQAYPYLEEEDIRAALAYAAWRAEEAELPSSPPLLPGGEGRDGLTTTPPPAAPAIISR
ncbi:MAG TPA: DUF433 domain-containing protein [Armatimonadota bacterium]|nr:DUF433 domain-containing protein [Armatimonadota bacterium]